MKFSLPHYTLILSAMNICKWLSYLPPYSNELTCNDRIPKFSLLSSDHVYKWAHITTRTVQKTKQYSRY
jgi:hypothetical protein